MPRPNKEAVSIFERIRYATLATVSNTGEPWNSPVYCAYDNDYNIYWGSNVVSQHSQNIRANGQAFIVIYDSTIEPGFGSGVYIKAQCVELTSKAEITIAHKLIQDRHPNPYWKLEEVQPERPVHLFKAVPQKIWTNGEGQENGQYIDIRVKAEA